ncbi:ABC transporter ATP-binding protein [Kocuria sp. cx-455]|uniref:ABC transporter ATP-binding protein n=1 Tax=Kocuria sp. cx-455 TaxID=2771377 RepID=UPI003D762FA0
MSTSHSAPGQPEGTPENNGSSQHAASGDAPWNNDAASEPESRRERRSRRGSIGKRGNRSTEDPGSRDVTDRPSRRSRSPRRVERGEPVLMVEGLSVDFGVDKDWVPAAIDLNYQVAAGEVLAIVGESGSGKSASSMSILGLLPSNARVSGSAKLAGEQLIGLQGAALRRVRGEEIAVIFQEPMTALNPVYTVGQQIVETIRLHRDLSPSQAAERAKEMLTMVELPDPEKAFRSYPHQLSGGQRQRAMIAQSLSCDPKLLIADEPTTALDVTVQAEILDLIRNLKDKLHSAVILITHDMGVVADLADRIAVMEKGRIVEQGPAEQIFSQPEHPYTKTLLESVPHLGEGGETGESVDMVAVLEREVEAEEREAAASSIDQETAAREEAPVGTEGSTAATATDRPTLPTDAARTPRHTEPSVDTAALRVTEPVLQLKNVAIEYPKQGRNPAFRAVEDVSLTVAAGEVLGLVGESGSGKTTIGRAAVGLLPVVEGSLIVDGQELSRASRKELNRVRKDVGMVFQDPSSSLNPRLPIGESIGEPMFLAGMAKGQQLQHRIEQLLDQVRLPRNYRNRYPHELSGGQKQRVGIARALSLKPKLLVADEPTSALDVSVQATVLDLFEELQAEMGFACLFVTHDLAVIDRLADRIVVMQHGRIVEQGQREVVLRKPEQDYTKRLLAAVPVPDPDTQRARRELRQKMKLGAS